VSKLNQGDGKTTPLFFDCDKCETDYIKPAGTACEIHGTTQAESPDSLIREVRNLSDDAPKHEHFTTIGAAFGFHVTATIDIIPRPDNFSVNRHVKRIEIRTLGPDKPVTVFSFDPVNKIQNWKSGNGITLPEITILCNWITGYRGV